MSFMNQSCFPMRKSRSVSETYALSLREWSPGEAKAVLSFVNPSPGKNVAAFSQSR